MALVSAVCTLVTASALATLKVTTWPATGLPAASLRTAFTSAGMDEETVVLLAVRVNTALGAAPLSTGVPG